VTFPLELIQRHTEEQIIASFYNWKAKYRLEVSEATRLRGARVGNVKQAVLADSLYWHASWGPTALTESPLSCLDSGRARPNLYSQQAMPSPVLPIQTLLDKGHKLLRVRHRRLLIDSLAARWRHRQTDRDDIHRGADIRIRKAITANQPT
jgi:hypothetical protein